MQKAQFVFAAAGLFGAVVLGLAVAAMWPDPNVCTVPVGSAVFGPGWLVGLIVGAFLAVLVVVGAVAVQRHDFERMCAAELRDYRERRTLSLSLTIAVVGACGAGIFLGLLVWSRFRPGEPAGWTHSSIVLLVGAAGGSACLAVLATVDVFRLIARRRRRGIRDRDVNRTR
ncbi:hypothetical protein [Rhodococcus jostii]|uniref:hypothetical protein n=1 Tax=Rhodococcus jostii TaxID=132919 RepID=UPI00363F4FBB